MIEESGDGRGKEPVDALIDGGVDRGLGGGEALRRRFVRREAKKADPKKSCSVSTLTLSVEPHVESI